MVFLLSKYEICDTPDALKNIVNRFLCSKRPILATFRALSPSTTQLLFDCFFCDCFRSFFTSYNVTQTPCVVFNFGKIFSTLWQSSLRFFRLIHRVFFYFIGILAFSSPFCSHLKCTWMIVFFIPIHHKHTKNLFIFV